MRKIPLTQGGYALVDDEDHERCLKWSWNLATRGYAVRVYQGTDGKVQTMTLQRYVLGLKKGDGRMVALINRNKLDCRRKNLRIFKDKRFINFNRGPFKHNTSGTQGVRLVVDRNGYKWRAWCAFLSDEKIGYFATKKEAIRARKIAERKRFDELLGMK